MGMLLGQTSYNEFLFGDYPYEDFDVEKIDEIVHSRY